MLLPMTRDIDTDTGRHAYQLGIASETSGNRPGMDVSLWLEKPSRVMGHGIYLSLRGRYRQSKLHVQRFCEQKGQCEESL